MQTLWFDSIILRLMGQPGPPTKLVFDEVAALQKLWQLHTALAEGRKHDISVVLGFQGYAQVEDLYGHQAETMLSQAGGEIRAPRRRWRSRRDGRRRTSASGDGTDRREPAERVAPVGDQLQSAPRARAPVHAE